MGNPAEKTTVHLTAERIPDEVAISARSFYRYDTKSVMFLRLCSDSTAICPSRQICQQVLRSICHVPVETT